jgi:competence protein CoiA
MQLFALDSQGELIAAGKADKSQDYFCLECQAPVRRRSGPHRQPHFFHLGSHLHCHLSGKGMVHLQIQCHLATLFPKGECFLEQRFPTIGRIADVAWMTKGLVFEIQCSPISAEEVEARNRDYATIGLQVVWILHDRRFNQRKISSAEFTLTDRPHYYTNINTQGQGIIYDQFALKKRGKRLKKLAPLPVDLSQPKFEKRLHFSGDLMDLCKGPYLDHIHNLQKEDRVKPSLFDVLEKWVRRPYRAFLHTLLERSCK